MITSEKIFVAVDFKPFTYTVLSYAVWLSRVVDCSSITLFHIMEYAMTPPAYLMPYIIKEKKKVETNLKELTTKLTEFQLNIDSKVVFGRLIDGIREVIDEERSFAVIGFKTHITRPSTSERILKGIKVPILIVKGESFQEINPEWIKIKNILCPVDFSENSLRALDLAKEISEKCDSNLTILYVVPEQKIRNIIQDAEVIDKYIDYLKEEAVEKFQKIDKKMHYQVLSGIPSDEILKKAEDMDLIIIGSQGRTYTEALVIGSVSEAIIKNSNKPILFFP